MEVVIIIVGRRVLYINGRRELSLATGLVAYADLGMLKQTQFTLFFILIGMNKINFVLFNGKLATTAGSGCK